MPPSGPAIPRSLQYLWLGFFILIACSGVAAAVYKTMQNPRITEVRERVSPTLSTQLATDGLALGNPAYIRIVKEERELELWMKPKGATEYKMWKKWPVVAMSGQLGPKQKEGDLQAPEGFYSTNAGLLNPASKYHLSFNIGYPNEFDRAHGRTGAFLMVHGNQVSLGCFAMTDPVIEEIYLIVESAIHAGQKEVPVHVYPFRMTEERMLQAEMDQSEWVGFWRDLRKGWVQFEEKKTVPKVKLDAVEKRYVVME